MFGDLVRAYRRRLGMSQEELAAKAGVSVRGLRKIEANQVEKSRPATVRLLANALGLAGDDRDQFAATALSSAGEARLGSLVPAQLPADVAGFTGRTEQLRRLTGILDGATEQPTAVVVITITGTAGVGKSALAVHWAHRVRHRFPDGQVYVNLRGFDPGGTAMSPAVAVRRVLDALEVPASRIPADLDAQSALYRTLLAGRRMLIVLDNARDTEQVRPLLPGAPGCLVLVTSRQYLSSLVAAGGAHPVTLDLLPAQEARDLLVRRLGPDRTTPEPEAVEEIVASCARLPLALAIAAARAATRPALPLHALAAELRERHDRLDVLAGEDATSDVRAVFSWSYRTLTSAAARLFRLLGPHPGPEISAPATASLAALPLIEVRSQLAELTRAHLLVEPSFGRYALHDLLRSYATERALSTEPEDERRAATERALDHYLHTGYAADRLLHPTREPIHLEPPAAGVVPEPLSTSEHALSWFTAEHQVLLAAVDQAVNAGLDRHAWQLAWILVDFLDRQGHWYDQVVTQRAALSAAGRLADLTTEALAHRQLARAFLRLERFGEAHTHLIEALDLYGRADDQAGQARTHLHLGMLWARQDRYAEALEHAQSALDLHRAADNPAAQAFALNAIGWYQAHLGDQQQALHNCQQALALHQQTGNRYGQAATWDSLGYAYHHLGRYSDALACYRQAIDLHRQLGDRYYEADTLTHIGDSGQAAGDRDAARRAWREALAILGDIGHPDADTVRARLAYLDAPGSPVAHPAQ